MASTCANGWPRWLAAHGWVCQRWSTSRRWSTRVAEINIPRSGNRHLRHPEAHTIPRTTDDGWKSGSSALLLIQRQPDPSGFLLLRLGLGFCLGEEGRVWSDAFSGPSPLSLTSSGPSGDAALPAETHMHVRACTEILGTNLPPPHEHGHGCASKLVMCPRSESTAAGGHRGDRTRR